MAFRKRVSQLDLFAILLAVLLVELALNRLLVPVLRPEGTQVPPSWHRHLDFVGLFTFHLASTLAIGVTLLKTWTGVTTFNALPAAARITSTLAVLALVALAAWSVVLRAPPSFYVESSFVFLVVLLTLSLASRPADWRFKLGLLLLGIPFYVHYFGTFAMRFFPDGRQWSSFPDEVRTVGMWTLLGVALLSPLVFTPRPLRTSLTRPGPWAVCAFVTTASFMILKRHYEIAMRVASLGFGIELAPALPQWTILLYVLALSALSWTLSATLTPASTSSRRVGVGIAIVVVGGYGFSWPLQFLCAAAGILALVTHGLRALEGKQAPSGLDLHSPPIELVTWESYLSALTVALGGCQSRTLDNGIERNIISGARGKIPFSLEINRESDSVTRICAIFGESPSSENEPQWTLSTRSTSILAIGTHPEPPRTNARQVKTGDKLFDSRFRIHDGDSLTATLLDDGLRARAAAVLDGWLAVWSGHAVCYQVFPGFGAPIDHPIPITTLSFRNAATNTESLENVLKLIGEIAERALRY